MAIRSGKKQPPTPKVQFSSKIKNCSVCGKIFVPVGTETVCKACYQKQQAKEEEIIDYIRRHQNESLEEAAAALGVNQNMLVKMLDEGKFDEIHAGMEHKCRGCGEIIYHGEFCLECSAQLKEDIKNATDSLRKNMRAGLRSEQWTGRSYLRRIAENEE